MILSASPVNLAIPYLHVIPDMMDVGIEYIDLDFNMGAASVKELKTALAEAENTHPFVLATKESFDFARQEYENKDFTVYTKALTDSVIANADGLLDRSVYPVMEYVLDEEDSILPISREVINRMVILGYAWQITGEKKYADILLCALLADKDGNTFVSVFDMVYETCYKHLTAVPELYQEALCLVASHEPEVLQMYGIDEKVWARYNDFAAMMSQGKTSQAMRKYADTYWVYSYR